MVHVPGESFAEGLKSGKGVLREPFEPLAVEEP